MEIYSPPSGSTSVPGTLVLQNAHLYGRLIGRGVCGVANVTFMALDVWHAGEIFILEAPYKRAKEH